MSYLRTMTLLCSAQHHLDNAQANINATRIEFADFDEVQLDLDRLQATLNAKRRTVTRELENIANQN